MVTSKYELSEEDRLAQSLDPQGFYAERLTKLESEAVGLERFVYKLFGGEVVRSVTFAIDPLHPFKNLTHGVSTVSRFRNFRSFPPLARSVRYVRTTIHQYQEPNATTIDEFHDRLPLKTDSTVTLNNLAPLTGQEALTGRIEDTSISTRPIGVTEGEFLLWKPYVWSPARSLKWTRNEDLIYNSSVPEHPGRDFQFRVREVRASGPAARFTQANSNTLYLAEKAMGETYIGDHVLRMVSNCMSLSRQFGLTYSVAELKDLPRSIRSTVEGIKDAFLEARAISTRKGDKLLRGDNDKYLSNQYLNSVFGWAPIYRDVVKLLRTPERIAKKINYLMARQGLPTAFRDSFKVIEPLSSPPGFAYDTYVEETQTSIGTTGSREYEMRCMINQTVELPQITVPKLREELLSQLWGLNPTPEDVYNLVPWSWLVDWFGGIGDYVKAYNVVNTDPSIINYGFMTYRSVIEIRTDRVGSVLQTLNTKNQPPLNDPGITVNTTLYNRHSSVYRSIFQLRKSIGNAFDMRPSYELSNFDGSQLAILGALLTMRT
jgi:hypothetical protein